MAAVLVALTLAYLVLAWPYLLGTWAAVRFGAGPHSTVRSLVGWVLEIPYLVCLPITWIASSRQKNKHEPLTAALNWAGLGTPAWILVCGLTGLTALIFGSNTTSHVDADPPTVVVPDFVGQTTRVLNLAMMQTHLQANVNDVVFAGSGWELDPADYVVTGISPKPGSRIASGSTITISCASKESLAFYQKPMPDLRGRDSSDINFDGVAPTDVTYQPDRGQPYGTIIDQAPQPGAALVLGQRIALTESG